MNPLKKKPKTRFTLICKFKTRNMLEVFFSPRRNIKLFLTTVNVLFMFFQGILTLESLAAAICLAYESGIPSACLLVLFITIRDNQLKKTTPPHKAVCTETRHTASTPSLTHAARTPEFQGHLMHYLQQIGMKAFDFFHC